MTIAVAQVAVLHEYLSGVMNRADHHGQGVNEIALTLAGAIIWRMDPESEIKVKEFDGEMKNVLWFVAGGDRYAVAYNHEERAIELRESSIKGQVLASFTNATTPNEVRRVFESL